MSRNSLTASEFATLRTAVAKLGFDLVARATDTAPKASPTSIAPEQYTIAVRGPTPVTGVWQVTAFEPNRGSGKYSGEFRFHTPDGVEHGRVQLSMSGKQRDRLRTGAHIGAWAELQRQTYVIALA